MVRTVPPPITVPAMAQCAQRQQRCPRRPDRPCAGDDRLLRSRRQVFDSAPGLISTVNSLDTVHWPAAAPVVVDPAADVVDQDGQRGQ